MNLKHAWAFLFDSLDYPFDICYMRHMNAIIEANLIRNGCGIISVPTERKEDSAGLLTRFCETGEREEDLSLSDIAAANEADRKAIDEYLRGRG